MLDHAILKTLLGLARAIRPWVDPASYRPLFLLAGIALVALLGPLAFDVAYAWIYSLPRFVRVSTGHGAVLLLVILAIFRLWTVRPADSWPVPRPPGEPGRVEGRWSARLVPWTLRLAVALLIVPIMEHPEGLGFADWDFVLDKWEALRRSIVEWGQFPWWNPWCRGGFPLAAEPQIGAGWLATPLVLAIGTAQGLRVAAILGLLIAVEGAYRLAWIWFHEPWASAAVALIYGLNGAVAVNTAQGYVLAMSYGVVPWLLLHSYRIGERLREGFGLGFWLAFGVMNGIQYLSFFGATLALLVWLRAARLQPPERRTHLILHTMAALGVFLAISGWRLGTVLPVILDDRREQVTSWDESVWGIPHYLLSRPMADWPDRLPGTLHAIYIELTSYVGPAAVLLALLSLGHGWRWWHTLALVCGWLSIGSTKWYQPSTWLMSWPVFASAHVVTRWRFLAILGLGLAAGSVLARWRRSPRLVLRGLSVLLVVAIGGDYFLIAREQLHLAFCQPPESRWIPGPAVAGIVNVRSGLGYPAVRLGYGVIEGYEPMLSYRRDAPTLRRARGDAEYRGEAWTTSGEVRPAYWSPNRIIFEVEPRQVVNINQNPGSWWWANGRQAFPGLRCAEPKAAFVVRADENGRVDLQIRPPGLTLGIGLHVAGVALILGAWMCGRIVCKPKGPGREPG